MSLVPLLNAQTAPADSQPVLAQIQSTIGFTSGMFKAAAHSPATLKSLWGAFAAHAQGALEPQLRELLAVAIAERNGCAYCLSAHMALGRKAGASAEELAAARRGIAPSARSAAALSFAIKLVEARGHVSEADLQSVCRAGYNDGEIVEIIGVVALNVFTNYLNTALEVPLDFPPVAVRRP